MVLLRILNSCFVFTLPIELVVKKNETKNKCQVRNNPYYFTVKYLLMTESCYKSVFLIKYSILSALSDIPFDFTLIADRVGNEPRTQLMLPTYSSVNIEIV